MDASELLAAVWKVFNGPKGGSGIDSEAERPNHGEFNDKSPTTEKKRLHARHSVPGRQNCDPAIRAGGADPRKEQDYYGCQIRYC
jgi:hypothetical protein